jgi:arabinofuranan 3-O-arabinosyltransferase
MSIPSWTRRLFEAGAYLAVAAAVAAAIFLNAPGEIAPDTKPELYLAPERFLSTVLSAWRPSPTLGDPNFNTGSVQVAAAAWTLAEAGVDPTLINRFIRLALLMVAGAGAAVLYHRTSPQPNALGRVAATTAYLISPFVVVQAASLPILQPFAFLPWMVAAYQASLRRPRGWRGPATTGLAFFLMGGENAGVVPLMLLVALGAAAVAARIEGAAWRQIGKVSVRTLVMLLAVSVYWLVPAVFAAGSGISVAAATETPADIAATLSYSETLRGLGVWPLYGGQRGEPFLPALQSLVTNPLIVGVSFLVPLVAAVGAAMGRRTRLLPVLMLAFAVPVVVGMFPAPDLSPLGAAFQWAFEDIPGAIAFRTTHKAAAAVALAVAILWGACFEIVAGWRLTRVVPLAVGGAAVLVVSAFPALTGNLYRVSYQIPGYWLEAAADLNAASDDHRVLFVPGIHLARYRWGLDSPDDVTASLISRPMAQRVTVPSGSSAKSNMLAALDVSLNTDSAPAGAISSIARYLGVAEIVARHDLVWEHVDGAPPTEIANALAADASLVLETTYGARGENTGAATELPPLQLWRVEEPRTITRTEPAGDTLLIDGDGFSILHLAASGMVDGEPPFLLLGSAEPSRLAQALEDGARVVLTDTNRRRGWSIHRLGASYTHTLGAQDRTVAGRANMTLTLTGDPRRQTVARLEGAREITASGSGSVFGLSPRHRPLLAFDADPSTSWRFGDFGNGEGQWIEIEFTPRLVDRVELLPADTAPVRVSRVELTVGDEVVEADLSEEGATVVPIPPVQAGSVRVEITATKGAGINGVGFAEIGVPGLQVTEVTRLPDSLGVMAPLLDAAARQRLREAPLDIVVARVGDATSDEESGFVREFSLPDPREFGASGWLSVRDLDEELVDRLAGLPRRYHARSSSRAFGNSALRASQAIDGRFDTAWRPAAGEGEWLDVFFPARVADHITIYQDETGEASFISRALVTVDDDEPIEVELTPGANEVPIRPQTVGRVRIEVVATGGLGGLIGINEIEVGPARWPAPTPAGQPLEGCVPLLQIDGSPIAVSLSGSVADLIAGRPLDFRSCEPIRLSAGLRRLEAVDGIEPGLVRLLSPGGESEDPEAAAPRAAVEVLSDTHLRVRLDGSAAPFYLVAGMGYDDRWRAVRNGLDLGPPLLLDGYSIGWRINDVESSVVDITYTPQRVLHLSILFSTVVVVLCLMLAWRPKGAVGD